jgi:hypothetical protein
VAAVKLKRETDASDGIMGGLSKGQKKKKAEPRLLRESVALVWLVLNLKAIKTNKKIPGKK